jgi:Fe2+ or Zn2+ uptake regulation protein
MAQENSRNTSQRIKIVEYLKEVKTHPTAEAVYLEVKKELPAITLATVYRNLNLLADQGEVLRLEINKEYHFDGDVSNHQHCVCVNCGRIIDIFQKEVSKYVLDKIKTKNFTQSSVTIIINGLCKECS